MMSSAVVVVVLALGWVQQGQGQGANFNIGAMSNSVGGRGYNTGNMPFNRFAGGSGNYNSRNGGGSTQPYCQQQEKRLLFDNCGMSFGMAHMSSFTTLRANAPKCRSDLFQCNHVDRLVRCVNSQPASTVTDNCWMIIKDVLGEFLQSYGIPCGYPDLYERCKNESITDILPMDQRARQGEGMNTNPMSYVMPMVNRYLTPLVMAYYRLSSLGSMLAL
ncbi:uncharacterized protein [Littorina saxatilis]|uniref:Uncharacterized protein n=1 Tax=Littorina saxatilis TaxID=31220 RepID=A0AAN9BTW3_9CAEN